MASHKEVSSSQHCSCFSSMTLCQICAEGIQAALYDDDLAIWCKEEYASTAISFMQQAVNKVSCWADD